MTILPNPFLFSTLDPETGVETAAAPDLTDPPVAAADRFARAFDPEKFFEAIEPLPIFLDTPRSVAEILRRY